MMMMMEEVEVETEATKESLHASLGILGTGGSSGGSSGVMGKSGTVGVQQQHKVKNQRLTCVVRSCPSPGGIRYFSLPKDPEVLESWIEAGASREDLTSRKQARICEMHFSEDCFERDLRNELLNLPLRRLLKKGSVPTLYLDEAFVVEDQQEQVIVETVKVDEEPAFYTVTARRPRQQRSATKKVSKYDLPLQKKPSTAVRSVAGGGRTMKVMRRTTGTQTTSTFNNSTEKVLRKFLDEVIEKNVAIRAENMELQRRLDALQENGVAAKWASPAASSSTSGLANLPHSTTTTATTNNPSSIIFVPINNEGDVNIVCSKESDAKRAKK